MLKRTTILIDPDLLERLDRFAARAGATKTSVIATALEAHLELNDTVPDLPFLAVGRPASGRAPRWAEAWPSFSIRAPSWPRQISRI